MGSIYLGVLTQVVDGEAANTYMNWTTTDASLPKHVHVKVRGGDLGVWLEQSGVWTPAVIDPDTDGQGLLLGPDAG